MVDSVAEAVSDVGFVAATTSRPRDQNFAHDLHDAALRIFEMSERGPAAVLFGAERTGLTNEELALAHLLIRIPANPEYASLNLAMAVQLTTYELFRAAGSPASARPLSELTVPLAPGADMERLYAHLQSRTRSSSRINHRRHVPYDAPATPVPALRDGPERGQHPARHPTSVQQSCASGAPGSTAAGAADKPRKDP